MAGLPRITRHNHWPRRLAVLMRNFLLCLLHSGRIFGSTGAERTRLRRGYAHSRCLVSTPCILAYPRRRIDINHGHTGLRYGDPPDTSEIRVEPKGVFT